MSVELAVFLAYLLGLLAFGFYFYGKTKDVEDYYVAGRGLGRWVLAFTHEASDLSGFLLMALPGFAYLFGMAGAWMVWTGTTGVLFVFAINSVAVRRFGLRYGTITVPDILETRYYDEEKKHLRIVSVVFIVTCTFLYVSAQCMVAGKILELAFGLDYTVGVLIGGGVILIYTVMGGMRAVAWTDFVQGILMIVGVVLACVLAVRAAGGIGAVFSGLRDIDPSLTTPFPDSAMVLMGIGFILGGGSFSYLGQPHLQMRYLSARSNRDLADALVVSLVIVSIFSFGAFVAGAAGRVIYPELSMLPGASHENILLHLFSDQFPGLLSGLLLAAAMAALMSSADSWLLVSSSGVARDLYQKVLRPNASDETMLKVSRYATAGIAILGMVTALIPRSIMWAVWLPWGGLAQFGPVLVLGMYWKRATRRAALASLVLGFTVNMGWYLLGWHEILNQAVPGMIVGVTVLIVVSLADEPPPTEIGELVDYVRTGRTSER